MKQSDRDAMVSACIIYLTSLLKVIIITVPGSGREQKKEEINIDDRFCGHVSGHSRCSHPRGAVLWERGRCGRAHCFHDNKSDDTVYHNNYNNDNDDDN